MEAVWRQVEVEIERVCAGSDYALAGDPNVLLMVLRSIPDSAGMEAVMQTLEQREEDGGTHGSISTPLPE